MIDDDEKKRVELERERKKGADSYITKRENMVSFYNSKCFFFSPVLNLHYSVSIFSICRFNRAKYLFFNVSL